MQAQVIRTAAQQPDGRLPRALVYELAEYEADRTLRGFTRPANRITWQLQREGLVPPGIAPALEAVYEDGVHAAYLAVPPDVRNLLAEPSAAAPSYYVSQKRAFEGPGALLAQIPSEDYRLAIRYILDSLNGLHGLKIYWGTTGCSLRVAVPGRGLLSVGWIFPPDIPRWMGLTDLTLGWDDDRQGVEVSDAGQAALNHYFNTLSHLDGEARPDSGVIRGWTFKSAAVAAHASELAEAIHVVVSQLGKI